MSGLSRGNFVTDKILLPSYGGNWNEALVGWGKRDVVWHCQVRPQ